MKMKTISFRVCDKTYYKLKEKKQSFRSIFEHFADEQAQNNTVKLTHTPCIQKNSDDLYNYLCLVKENIEKIIKSLEV